MAESGKLEKMLILAFADSKKAEDGGLKEADDSFEALINPETYTLDYKLKFSESGQGHGTSGKQLKYEYTAPEEITFEFLFDDTGIIDGKPRDSIAEDIKKFKQVLIEYKGDAHEPRHFKLVWGQNSIFKGRVTEGRANKLTKPIDEIAGGRVFTGKQALELGLVDKLGTLSDAIAFAAAQAKISDYETRVLPEPKKLMDIIVEALGGGKEENDFTLDTRTARRWSLLAQDAPLLQTLLPLVSELEPMRARALLTALTRLQLIHEEGAVMMMPFELVVH